MEFDKYPKYVYEKMEDVIATYNNNPNFINIFKKYLQVIYHECPDKFDPKYFGSVLYLIVTSYLNIDTQIKLLNIASEYGAVFYNYWCSIDTKISGIFVENCLNEDFLKQLILKKFPFNNIQKLVKSIDIYKVLTNNNLLSLHSRKFILIQSISDNNTELFNFILESADIHDIVKRINGSICHYMSNFNKNLFKRLITIPTFSLSNENIKNCLAFLRELYKNYELYGVVVDYIIIKMTREFKNFDDDLEESMLEYYLNKEMQSVIGYNEMECFQHLYNIIKLSSYLFLAAFKKCYKKKWVAGFNILFSDMNPIKINEYYYERAQKYSNMVNKKDPYYRAISEKLLLKFIVNGP